VKSVIKNKGQDHLENTRPNGRSSRNQILFAIGLILLTLVSYGPGWNGKLIWDDDAHLTRAELRSLGGLERIWLEPGATQQYYPLVHTVFWIEHRLFGEATLPYHLFNIFLHALGAWLLFKVLVQLKIPGAWLAAAIFALHPIQVESVAWISELKNTLSGVFFFSALFFYLRFDQSRSRAGYLLALTLFILGLLCKTTIAPLPAVLLVIFWWQRTKLSPKRDLLPLVPFFVIGIGAGLFTAWMEHRFIGAQGQAFHFGLIERCLIAGRAFWFYLFKLFWPANLIFIYPRWEVSRSLWWQYLFPIAALLFFAALFALRNRSRAPLAACLIFAGLLFPALGFINVYPFIYSFVADHFQYLASAPVISLAAAGFILLCDRFHLHSTVRYATALTLLVFLASLTWLQAHTYSDVETLWRVTLSRNPNCWLAHNNLGAKLLVSGNSKESIVHLRKALEINPLSAEAHNDLGDALSQEGESNEAVAHYLRAIEIKSAYAAPHTNLGELFLRAGRMDESLVQLEEAVKIDPHDANAQNNLGNTLLQMGKVSEAIRHYEATVDLRIYQSKFEQAKAHYNLANALAQHGESDEAIAHYRKTLELQPNYADAHNNLARAFAAKNEVAQAIAHYQKASEIAPNSALFQNNLAWQLATCPDSALRDGARAAVLAEKASKLAGGQDPVILNTLAAAYAETGRFPEALEVARHALQLGESVGDTGLVEALRHEISLYEANMPYHRVSN